MGPIKDSLREKIPPALLRGVDINADFQKILVHSVKHGGLVIMDPQLSAESAYNISKTASGKLVYSLLGGTTLN